MTTSWEHLPNHILIIARYAPVVKQIRDPLKREERLVSRLQTANVLARAVRFPPGISSGRITQVSPPSFQTVVPFAGNPLPRGVADSSRAGGDSASLFFPGLRHRNAVDSPALEEHVSEAPSKHALKQPMSLTPLSRGGNSLPPTTYTS